jgi:hypothetical protein
MVLRLKPRESRTLPGLPRTEVNPLRANARGERTRPNNSKSPGHESDRGFCFWRAIVPASPANTIQKTCTLARAGLLLFRAAFGARLPRRPLLFRRGPVESLLRCAIDVDMDVNNAAVTLLVAIAFQPGPLGRARDSGFGHEQTPPLRL